jgi:hypothetical protein
MATQKNKAALIAEFIAAIFPNTSNQIDAQLNQDAVLNLLESVPFILDNPEIFIGLTEYVTSSTYNTGDVAVYLGKIYQATEDGITGAWDVSKWTSIPQSDELAAFTAWDNVTSYVLGNTVRDDSRIWKSLTSNLASKPQDNPGDWDEVSPQEGVRVLNPWVAGIYSENTLVVYLDKLYYMSPTGTTLDSTDPATEIGAGDWTKIADVGTGLTGLTQYYVQRADASTTDIEDGTIYDDGTSVVIGGTSSNIAVELKLQSTTKGFLPNMLTTTQRNALTTPPKGLLIFNSTTNRPETNVGTSGTPIWTSLTDLTTQTLQAALDGGATGSIAGAISITSSAGLLALLGNTLSIQGLLYPNADGTAGQVITTDGAGNLSFTTITVATPNMQAVAAQGSTITIGTALNLLSQVSAYLKVDNGGINTVFDATITSATMKLNDTTNDKSIVFTASDMVVTDTIDSTGLRYAADYKSNFVGNSLITKAWVDAQGYLSSSDGNGIYSASGTVPTTIVATITDTLEFTGGTGVIMSALTYTDGNQAAGKFLTSDVNGLASWATVPSPVNTLLDGTNHSDTLAGAVLEGSIIIGNNTPKWSALAIGANGTVLTSNGITATWVAGGADGNGIYDGNGSLTASTTVTQAGSDLVFSTTGDSQALFIEGATGFVGVNVDPAVPLHVNGNVRFDTTNDINGGVDFNHAGGTSAFYGWRFSDSSVVGSLGYGMDVKRTGANSNNYALNVSASGATHNVAIRTTGDIEMTGSGDQILMGGLFPNTTQAGAISIIIDSTSGSLTSGVAVRMNDNSALSEQYGFRMHGSSSSSVGAGNTGYGFHSSYVVDAGTVYGGYFHAISKGTEDFYGVYGSIDISTAVGGTGTGYAGYFQLGGHSGGSIDDVFGNYIDVNSVHGTFNYLGDVTGYALRASMLSGTDIVGDFIGLDIDVTNLATVTGNTYAAVLQGGAVVIGKATASTTDYTLDVDGIVGIKEYTVAGVPTVPASGTGLIAVTDETGGHVLAFSDGTDWRRVTDRAVVA